MLTRSDLTFLNLEQEDKEPVFDSVKTIMGMLEVSAEFADNITFNQERIRNALPAGHLDATTLADYLVKKVRSRILLPPILICNSCFSTNISAVDLKVFLLMGHENL